MYTNYLNSRYDMEGIIWKMRECHGVIYMIIKDVGNDIKDIALEQALISELKNLRYKKYMHMRMRTYLLCNCRQPTRRK